MNAPADATQAKPDPLRIAYLTAGGAGMFCGSCLRDNALAAAVTRLGEAITLIPTYTPIRTDEEDVSLRRVFFGGVNVYLQQRIPLFRFLPGFLDHWLDHPRVIRFFASRGIETDAELLGALTVSMLRGEAGAQRKEVRRLVRWLGREVRPDIVNLTNILIAGCVPAIKRTLGVPVLVTLQGDDIFLRDLDAPFREQALEEIRKLDREIDGYVVFSDYYADFMAEYLGVSREKMHRVPLGIRTADFHGGELAREVSRPPTVGYFARICNDKGFPLLVDAFLKLKTLPGTETARLRVAGWLSRGDRADFEAQRDRVESAGHAGDFDHAGVLERREKVSFLRSLDVLSVPTRYREPKGLFVLEALACGVPVVEPAHGALPELIKGTGGGRLVPPGDADALAAALHELLTDESARRALGEAGRKNVLESFTDERMAAATLELYRKFCPSR